MLEQEIELPWATEAVAAARRALPPGGAVRDDYAFEEARPDGKARRRAAVAAVRAREELARDLQLAAHEKLLASEKEATRTRDALAAERRRLPMVRFDKDYAVPLRSRAGSMRQRRASSACSGPSDQRSG